MILGIGTDLLQIQRMEQALLRTPKLADRILTVEELDEFTAAREPARFLAKRFAAKEAVVKALGTGIGRGVSWQHIDIGKNPAGQPLVELTGGAAQVAVELGIRWIHLSYSDERDYVLAFAVAEGQLEVTQ